MPKSFLGYRPLDVFVCFWLIDSGLTEVAVDLEMQVVLLGYQIIDRSNMGAELKTEGAVAEFVEQTLRLRIDQHQMVIAAACPVPTAVFGCIGLEDFDPFR